MAHACILYSYMQKGVSHTNRNYMTNSHNNQSIASHDRLNWKKSQGAITQFRPEPVHITSEPLQLNM